MLLIVLVEATPACTLKRLFTFLFFCLFPRCCLSVVGGFMSGLANKMTDEEREEHAAIVLQKYFRMWKAQANLTPLQLNAIGSSTSGGLAPCRPDLPLMLDVCSLPIYTSVPSLIHYMELLKNHFYILTFHHFLP